MTTIMRPQPGTPREYHFPGFERRILDNGLTVIVAPVRKLPVVSVVAVIDLTALDDPAGVEGLAELTSQALREGTHSRTGIQLALDLEKLGTSVEAGADWDSTLLSMTVLRARLEPALEIFAEVLTLPAFETADVERLKSERLAERMQILAEPRGLADESFSRFIYREGARYGRPMSGTAESVSRITSQEVREFYEEGYTPDAVTLIMVGDLSVGEGVDLAEGVLGSWGGARDIIRGMADTPARVERSMQIVAKPDAAQSELRIGHVGVPRLHPDYFSIVVMNAVLGGLFSSRINLNLREKHGYTYGASSYYDWRRQSGPFVISTAVQSEVTAAAISESLKEIERMQTDPVETEELTLATSYLEGVFPIRYETTASIASALANLVMFDLPEDYYDTYRSNISAVTTDDVLRASREHVRQEALQIVVVGDPSIIRDPLDALGFGSLAVKDDVEA
jgi:zinc protease